MAYRKNIQAKIERGECTDCRRKASPGKLRCETHRKIRSDAEKRRHLRAEHDATFPVRRTLGQEIERLVTKLILDIGMIKVRETLSDFERAVKSL